jgi:hypothetical protein
MRTTSEGQATDTAVNQRSNRLKVLKKLSFKILQKAVDKVAIRCRMRASKQAVSRLDFRRFSEAETS